MKTGTVVVVAGLGIVGLLLLAAKKAISLKSVFDQMKIWPTKIKNFNLSIAKQQITFDLDFNIQNPTTEDFSVSGASIVRIKSVAAYRNGTYIGQADVDLTEIDIPANSTMALTDLPFVISLQSLLDNLATITDFTVESLTTGLSIVATVDVVGATYTIEG